MWILLILVVAAGYPDTVQVLEHYEDENACILERDRIWAEMNVAYPGATDYLLDCHPVQVPKQRED